MLFSSFESCAFYSNYEVILIDNASSDGSAEYVEGLNNDKIKIIRNTVNESFSKANNDGAKEAGGEYLLFLNNDIEVTEGWLDEMLEAAFKDENCGCVGAKLVYPEIPDDRINKGKSFLVQHNGIAFKDSEFEGEYFIRPYNKNNAEDVFECSSGKITKEIAVTAACLLVKKEIFFGAGGFDEGYVYGYEDVDLCLKIHRMGYNNYLCPTALLFHYEFGTQINSDRIEVSERRTANTHLFMSRWQNYLKETIFNDKLNSEMLFCEKKLKVAFCVTEAGDEASAGDYFTAMELALSLEKLGYETKYLTRRGEGDWYDVGRDVDVLISMLDSYDVNMMKNVKEDIITIAWARNWFERWAANPSFYEYSLVFASSPKACDYILKETGRKAELFPIASNHERFMTENIEDNPENKNRFEADYVFTGSYWNSPREIIDIIAPEELPYSFKVFGKNWENVPSMAAYTGGFVNYKDIPSVYKYAKIVVDDANAVTKEYGAVNSRVYDALAAGCLVITNGAEGSKDIFNNMLPVFKDRSEFLALVDFYMKDEKARNEKIKELRDFVLENHTYDIRAKQLKDILKKSAEKDEKKIAIMAPVPKWSEAESWGDYHFAKAMKKCFDKQGYETEIRILPQWEDDFDGKYVIVLRGLSVYKPRPEHINIMWNISHPDDISIAEYNQYDKVYISSLIQAEKIKKLARTSVEPLLQCTDPDVFKPSENAENKYELLFVGNSRKVMRKIIKDLIPTEYSLSVFGTNWEGLIDDDYIKGENIPNRLLSEEYASCAILLNDHWEDMSRRGFISNRIFDGLACGAFIISDEVDGLEDVLKGCVVTYKDKKDLADKIKYYMNNSDERKKIAQKGMEAVREEHTFEKRMSVISEFIKGV
ncbi:MAG: glycosyltransferase [Eubacterium sp.]|nr:glycosyltransferase [Eubacterium sp.]